MSQKQIDPALIASVVESVMATMGGGSSASSAPAAGKVGTSVADYPLGTKRPDRVKSASGLRLADITLEKVVSGEIKFEDVKIRPETLEQQAEIAKSAGRASIASNLKRAAEMTRIPDDRVLEMYNALRPYRSTREELLAMASELETKYQAKVCAEFVREACEVYGNRDRLKKA